jgi:hypothetical protein
MKSASLSLLCVFAALTCRAIADDKNNTWTDPAKAAAEDPDFSIQGEYTGKLGADAVGVQVVAEGGGKFSAVLYPGGLPGDGWNGDRKTRSKGKAETKDGVTSVDLGTRKATIKEGKMVFAEGALNKVNRTGPTLGAKAPENALTLFDGKDPGKFQNGRLDGDTLMQGITSKDLFESCTLHIEFKIPYQPAERGQGRGNSGIYLQGRYEVQMLDSFGLEGRDNECGGIYSIKAPDVNMAFPPLTWQAYDIDYTAAKFENGKKVANARITVRHNGVLVHKDVELDHGTTAAPVREGAERGPIHVQDHGNPVRYRNIWIVEKK